MTSRLRLQRLGVADLDGDERCAADLVQTASCGRNARPIPRSTIRLAASIDSTSSTTLGTRPGAAEEAVRQRPVAGAAVEEDQGLGRHLLEPGAGPRGPSAPPGADTSTSGSSRRLTVSISGMLERAGQPELGLAGQHHLQHLLGVAGAHRDERLGMRGLEALEDVGQQVGADRQRGGDGEGAAAGRPQVVHGLAGQRDRLQELLGVGAQGAPGRRQRQPGAARARTATRRAIPPAP